MGEHRTNYVVSSWIAHTGPWAQVVELTDAEFDDLDRRLHVAEVRGAIYEAMLEPVGGPMSYAAYRRPSTALGEASE